MKSVLFMAMWIENRHGEIEIRRVLFPIVKGAIDEKAYGIGQVPSPT